MPSKNLFSSFSILLPVHSLQLTSVKLNSPLIHVYFILLWKIFIFDNVIFCYLDFCNICYFTFISLLDFISVHIKLAFDLIMCGLRIFLICELWPIHYPQYYETLYAMVITTAIIFFVCFCTPFIPVTPGSFAYEFQIIHFVC